MNQVEENAEGAVDLKDETPVEDQTSKDPLDAIEDEATRKLAKDERSKAAAIATRRAKKEEETEPEPVAPQTNYATKDDLKIFATRDAKNLVAPEVLEVWDELTKIPLGGFDPMDAADMAKNMTLRHTLYLQQNPDGADPTKDLTSSPNVPTPGAGPKAKATDSKPLPGYKEAAQPEDWYGKPAE